MEQLRKTFVYEGSLCRQHERDIAIPIHPQAYMGGMAAVSDSLHSAETLSGKEAYAPARHMPTMRTCSFPTEYL
jgi:hypothetical protein